MELIEEEDLARRATFPEKAEIREIACHLAARVFQMAVEEGIRVGDCDLFPKRIDLYRERQDNNIGANGVS